MDEIHAIRDREGADLVHLIVDRDRGGDYDVCGIAWRMVNVSRAASSTLASAVTDYRCGGARSRTSWATTWGSTMTATSWRTEGPLDSVSYPYSFGYVNQRAFEPGAPESSRWRTIMAYVRPMR